MTAPGYNRALHGFALLTAAATLALVSIGGLVTSHGVGLAVPDWPNTYGYNMFFFPISHWVGGVFYEHTHRLVASGVGLLTTILAFWLFGRSARPFMRSTGLILVGLSLLIWLARPLRWPDAVVLGATGLALLGASRFWPQAAPSPRWLRQLGLAAFLGVVLQGILGGLRVVLSKDAIGIFHALLAQLFFFLVCALALFTSQWWQERSAVSRPPSAVRTGAERWLGQALVGATALILVQLALGAAMRHQHAGLAIPDFPLAYGRIWPATDPASIAHYNQIRVEVTEPNPITAAQVFLQMVHRVTALLILGTVGLAAWLARRELGGKHGLTRWTYAWLGLITIQALLGATTVWSNKAADIATAHVLVGALSLALGGLLSIVWGRHALAAASPTLVRPSPLSAMRLFL